MTTVKHSRHGRPPTPPVTLPDIRFEAEALADWIKETEGPQRRPECTGQILGLAIVLHRAGKQPWPTRQQIKAHTGVSLPMIDVVMSQRQAKGMISVYTSTRPGNVQKRTSVITQRHVRPSQELLNVVLARQIDYLLDLPRSRQ